MHIVCLGLTKTLVEVVVLLPTRVDIHSTELIKRPIVLMRKKDILYACCFGQLTPVAAECKLPISSYAYFEPVAPRSHSNSLRDWHVYEFKDAHSWPI